MCSYCAATAGNLKLNGTVFLCWLLETIVRSFIWLLDSLTFGCTPPPPGFRAMTYLRVPVISVWSWKENSDVNPVPNPHQVFQALMNVSVCFWLPFTTSHIEPTSSPPLLAILPRYLSQTLSRTISPVPAKWGFKSLLLEATDFELADLSPAWRMAGSRHQRLWRVVLLLTVCYQVGLSGRYGKNMSRIGEQRCTRLV